MRHYLNRHFQVARKTNAMMEDRTPPGFHHQVRRRGTIHNFFQLLKILTTVASGATGEECLYQSVSHGGEHQGRKPSAAGQQKNHDQDCFSCHGTCFSQHQQPSGKAIPGRSARRLAGGNDKQAREREVLVQVWMPDPGPTVARQATADDRAHSGGCGICHSQVTIGMFFRFSCTRLI